MIKTLLVFCSVLFSYFHWVAFLPFLYAAMLQIFGYNMTIVLSELYLFYYSFVPLALLFYLIVASIKRIKRITVYTATLVFLLLLVSIYALDVDRILQIKLGLYLAGIQVIFIYHVLSKYKIYRSLTM